jgi:C1A family cysteine protease/DNA-binding beta-propeller fold protein YncE
MRVRVALLIAVVLLVVVPGGASGSLSLTELELNAPEGPQDHLAPTIGPALQPGGSLGGFVPPSLDLSHLKGELLPPDVQAADLSARFDWRDQGKVTHVQDQGECGACYTFGPIASFESRLLIDGAGSFDFSENHAKECIWEEANDWHTSGGRPVGSCDGGNHFQVANLFTQLGTVLEACDPYVASDVQCTTGCAYQKTLLDWRIVNGNSAPSPEVIKAYLQQYGPLVTSVYVGSFGAWHDEFVRYDGSYVLYHDGSETTDHCVLIVGWDDNLSHQGGSGAWIVKNSWGTDWGGTCSYGGERGYFYIAYGSASIGSYGAFPYAWQDYDPDGRLWLYDDAGLNDAAGWMGSTTDWGLAKFIAPQSTHITRVEFWTTDATSDVDVYIYGGFDGTRLSNLLHSVSNLSYSEAGYHSVPVDPPLPVSAGSTVVAVVKLSNVSYGYPMPLDDHGPPETQRTYHSPTGADGTWSDVGERFDSDVGIRLRTSGRQTVPTPTVSPTVKPFTPVAWSWLPAILKGYRMAPPPTALPTQTPVGTPSATATIPVGPTITPTASGAFTGVVSVSGEPYSLALNSANGRLYAARAEAEDVAVLTLSGLGWVAGIPLGQGPQAIRVDPALGRAYAGYGSPLFVLSCADNSMVGVIPDGPYGPSELAVNPANHRVYVADWSVFVGQPDRVHIFDGNSTNRINTVELGVSPNIENIAVAVNRNTGLAYAAYTGDGQIAVIGTDSQIHGRILPSDMAVPPYNPWMAVNSTTNRLYLRGQNTTLVVDLNASQEIGSLDQAGLIAVDETHNLVYVQRLSRIYVYDGASNAKLRQITLDAYRYVSDVACDAATRRIFLAAPSDNEIVVVAD